MSSTFSHMTRDRATFTHVFEDGYQLTIIYRPSLITPRQLHRIQALNEQEFEELTKEEQFELADTTQHMLAEVLVSWTAEDDYKNPIPPTFEGLEDIPYDAQAQVLRWIREDQRAGKANGNGKSGGSSTDTSASRVVESTIVSSPSAPNGTALITSPNGSE